ncbi:MAG: hypothetical protein R6W91_04200, partial [Thermoplasmata archaeon]
MARKRLLTVEEAILLHLLGHVKHLPEGDVPLEMTQAGISRTLGVRRSHVSASLDFARNRGTVEEHLSRVKAEKRKRKCYFLTAAGLNAARDIKARVLHTPIEATMLNGTGFSGSFENLLNTLKEPPDMARLALLCSDGRVAIPPDSGRADEPFMRPQIPNTGRVIGRERELG